MRHFLRSLVAVVLLLGPAAGLASAVTVPQLLALTKEGLGDDVLVALIQTDGSIFQLSATDILNLHRQGLSDRVIVAMVETAKKMASTPPRAPAVSAAPSEEAPSKEQPPIASVQPVAIPPPTVNVNVKIEQPAQTSQASYPYAYGYPYSAGFYGVPVSVPFVTHPAVVAPATMPVYWGWGGQRRPDTWEAPRLVNPTPGVITQGPGNRKGG